ncbi:coatomer subunit beta'-like isoform X2 [Gouania willdenowi]|nr:coatomer subunit beta'-like isoform X2 [Gouania willdenowi]
MVKRFELCDLPVRMVKFVARKHWLIAGADDMQIRVFNYNTLERVHMFEAHADYIRCIAVHPTQPYILTSSDDMLIKLWDWEKKWVCSQVFEGHSHYVMQIVINPKDNNQFASASLDRTIKVWQLGSRTPNFTLEGHEKGVNCIDYYSGGDKPYLISGADDRLVKIWDYQNKTCVQTLEGHAQNVTAVNFHPELPIILSGSEDGTVRVWHTSTYRLENTLNYSMERVWCICSQQGSNSVAVGFDEGSIFLMLGREEPAMSMDASGKVMWARHSEVQQANMKTMGDTEIRDGERLPLGVKDMGSCEIFPQTIQHSPNGRFVVVCGDGEYIIYTAMALRNKSFGSAQEFVWAHDSSQYAVRESTAVVKIFKNFKQKKVFKPDFGAEGIFGGFLLGVRSNSSLAFFDWENAELIRRIEIQPKHIFWSDSGELVCIATSESYFVLRYFPERVAAAQESKEDTTEDGIEDALEVLGEVQEVVKTGAWVGDCFIYTSSVNRLNYYVGGEIITIAHMDRTMYLLGYIPKDDRLYLGDKELNVVSYSLLLSMLEYQTAVMRKDFSTADKVLPTIPKEQRTRVAHFLEKQGFKQQALAVSTDLEHRFELALQLGELQTAYELALEAEGLQSEHKWKQLAELATAKCQFNLAQECLHQAQDYGGLLLLATTSGNMGMVGKLSEGAERDGKTNVAFLTYFIQGRVDKCLDLLIKTDRLPEAAFLARTYMPSHVSRVIKLWKESLSKVNQKAADALADPTEYSNLFPGLQQALLAEQYLQQARTGVRAASEYALITPNEDRDVLEEAASFTPKEADLVQEEEVMNVSEDLVEPEEPEVTHAESEIVMELLPPEDKPVLTPPATPDATMAEEHPVSTEAREEPEILVPVEEKVVQETALEITSKEADIELRAEIDVPQTSSVAFSLLSTPETERIAVTEEASESSSLPETQTFEEASPSLDVLETSSVALSLLSTPETESIAVTEEASESSSLPETQTFEEASPSLDVLETSSVALSLFSTPETESIAVTEEASESYSLPETQTFEEASLSLDVLETSSEARSVPCSSETEESTSIEEAPHAVGSPLMFEASESVSEVKEVETHVYSEAVPKTDPEAIEQLSSSSSSVVVEELISFETAMDAPVPVQSFPQLVLDPPAETELVLEPEPVEPAAPEEENTHMLLVEPEDEAQESSSAGAPANVGVKEDVKEEEKEPPEETEERAEDLEAELDDEDLDDLDLDNFDLEDIDTTDINLDDDILEY